MDPLGFTVYNMPPMAPRWDRVGIFYVSFCATWTTLVVAGMTFCWYNRHLPILRVRRLPLAFGAVTFLHLYWIMAQITYPIGATMPIVIAYDVQYFVMGTWFPLGIALFHASNLRFLQVAALQKKYTQSNIGSNRGCNGARSPWLCRFRSLGYSTKLTVFVVTGMVFQTLLTIGMWLACRKYHPSFGIPGTEIRGATLPSQLRDLGIGWEWWPSVVWQFIWTWGVAPVLIWKSWGIHDTMGWRTQTIGSCISGLHATPMFLIASYSPAFYTVNAYFHPSQWIHLHTMLLEAFVIFIPAYQVVCLWRTSRVVAYSNEKWEISSQATTIRVRAPSEKGSAIELVERHQIFKNASPGACDRLLTMTALNRVLQEQPMPLQDFSACHDFSGENIAFLTRVAKWKAEWINRSALDHEQHRSLYNTAMRIYIDFISPRDAQFPLNLSFAQLKDLEAIFESPTRIVRGEARLDLALPFTFDHHCWQHSGPSEETMAAHYTGPISGLFSPHVFDEAQSHIKDLVLTNTWPKFVKEMQLRRGRSMESTRSGVSESSDATVVSRVSKYIKSLV